LTQLSGLLYIECAITNTVLEPIQRFDLFQVENQMAIDRVPPVLHKGALVKPPALSQAAGNAAPISNRVV